MESDRSLKPPKKKVDHFRETSLSGDERGETSTIRRLQPCKKVGQSGVTITWQTIFFFKLYGILLQGNFRYLVSNFFMYFFFSFLYVGIL